MIHDLMIQDTMIQIISFLPLP